MTLKTETITRTTVKDLMAELIAKGEPALAAFVLEYAEGIDGDNDYGQYEPFASDADWLNDRVDDYLESGSFEKDPIHTPPGDYSRSKSKELIAERLLKAIPNLYDLEVDMWER